MASQQKPKDGVSKQKPNQGGGHVVSVRSRRARFNRAGLTFTPNPTLVKESEIGPDRLARILAEPQLVCEEITSP